MTSLLRVLGRVLFSRHPRGRHSTSLAGSPGKQRWRSPRFEELEPRRLLSWTVLVYLDGDNSLDSYGVTNVNQMESVNYPSDGSVKVVVQFDRAGTWTDTRRAQIVHDNNTSTMTSFSGSSYTSIPLADMGNPNTLTSFIQWGVTNYPARHYLLDLWDHGGGLDGVCWDDTSGTHLTVSQVQQAISAAGTHIDVIGFDACLMGMEEVAHQLYGLGDVMVASEESIPGDGWPYDTWVADLAANATMTAAQLGADIVQEYGALYNPQESDTTLSAVTLANEPALATSLNTFAQAAADCGEWSTITAARNTAHNYQGENYLDLSTFLQYVGAHASDAALKSAANAAFTAEQAAVAQNYSGSAEGGTGLSIYFPAPGSSIRSDYTAANFLFVNDTQWRAFLSAFVTSAAPRRLAVASSTPAADSAVAAALLDYTLVVNNAYDPTSVQAADLTVNSVAADSVTLVDSTTLTFHYTTAPMSAPGNCTMSVAAGAIARLSDGSPILVWSAGFRIGVPHISVAPSPLTASAAVGTTADTPLNLSNTGNWDLNWTSPTGYAFTDSDHSGGPTYSWVDISTTGTAVSSPGDDNSRGPYNIGFSFPFYGTNFTTFRVCSNGFLSFSDSSTAYSNTSLPSTAAPMNLVALAWDDLDLTGAGMVYYKQTDADTLVVEFLNAPYYGYSTKLITAEAILKSDGSIKLQYQRIDYPNEVTVGIQDATGAHGVQVVNNTAYLHTNMAVQIAWLPANWLSLSPSSGTTAPGTVTHCIASFNAAGLAAGTYTTSLPITANDPSQSSMQIPVTFTVTGPASKVVFLTQPANAFAATRISPAVQVAVEDANGNVVGSESSNVTIAIGANPCGGTLCGALTVAAINGIATFSNLSIDKVGTGYTLTATDGSLTGATSSGFTIALLTVTVASTQTLASLETSANVHYSIVAGGDLTVTAPVVLASGGALHVTAGGRITVAGIDSQTGAAGIGLDAGTLRASDAFTSAAPLAIGGSGATIDSNGCNLSLIGPISGTGELIKSGVGRITLSGDNTFSGGVRVLGGSVRVTTPQSLLDGAALTVGVNSTLFDEIVPAASLAAGTVPILVSAQMGLSPLPLNATNMVLAGDYARAVAISTVIAKSVTAIGNASNSSRNMPAALDSAAIPTPGPRQPTVRPVWREAWSRTAASGGGDGRTAPSVQAVDAVLADYGRDGVP